MVNENEAGGIAVTTENQLIELRISRDFHSYSQEEQERLLDAIRSLLHVRGELKVVSKMPGSVLLTLDLPTVDAEALYALVHSGALNTYDVEDARLIRANVSRRGDTEWSPLAHEDRKQTAHRVAADMFNHTPDWVTFFREVLGVDGLIRKLFSNADDLAAFEKTSEWAEIQSMLARLREREGAAGDDKEPTRIITVRLPKSLHESLRAEANDRNTSMNQLCITKLLMVIDAEMTSGD